MSRILQPARVPICGVCGAVMDWACEDGDGRVTCDGCHRTLKPIMGFYAPDLGSVVADMRKVADQLPSSGSVDAAGAACGEFLREFADRIEKECSGEYRKIRHEQ